MSRAHYRRMFLYAKSSGWRFQAFFLVFCGLILWSNEAAVSQVLSKDSYVNLRKEVQKSGTSRIGSNDFYQIIIEEFIGAGVGLYSVGTGHLHDITSAFETAQDLTFGGSKDRVTGTSYLTVRSYTSNTDYVQIDLARPDSAFKLVWLDSTFISETKIADNYFFPISTGERITGFRVVYEIPGLAILPDSMLPDSMRIVQIVNVHGSNFDDSWVENTVIVENLSSRALEIGIRFLWDLSVAGDDGPRLRAWPSLMEFGNNEAELTELAFPFFVASDNEAGDTTAYDVYGSVQIPEHMVEGALTPDRLQMVSWLDAFFRAFDYSVDTTRNVSEDPSGIPFTGGDNAIQFYWGDRADRSLDIPAGDSVRVTQALVAGRMEPPILSPERFLFGLDEDIFKLIKVDVNAREPTVIELGAVADAATGKVLKELQAMTWDPESRRILFLANRDQGRLYQLDADQIPDSETEDAIAADFIGDVGSVEIEGIAIHPVTGELYGVDTEGPDRLVTLDKTNGQMASIGPLGEFNDVKDIAFMLTPEPVLYGVDDITGKLITIDITTGIATAVNPENSIGFPNVESLEFAPDGNLFAFSEGTTPTFITIDPASGIGAEFPTMSFRRHDIEALTFMQPAQLLAGSKQVFANQGNQATLPADFTLEQNYPNPFNPATKIRFTIHEGIGATNVELHIYNLLGELVRVLVDESRPAGDYTVEWDGQDEHGNVVSSGIYLSSLKVNDRRLTMKMTLIR